MDTVALRYAEALFQIGEEEKKTDKLFLEIKEIISILSLNQEYLDVLSSAFLSFQEKEDLVSKAFKDFDKDIMSFIKVIIKNSRGHELIEILNGYVSLVNKKNSVLEGYIFVTEKLDEKLIRKIEEKISEQEGQKVHLIMKIDPTIIGGFKVLVNDHQYDNSLSKAIEQLRKSLLGGTK